MRIALDAMGGDLGPEMAIQGALAAVGGNPDLRVILVGPSDRLDAQLAELGNGQDDVLQRISVQHASEVITMHDSPVEAVRKKKEATIVVGFDLVKRKEADAVVSAGNSGATMAAAIRKLGRLPGIARPGIASFFPTVKKPVMLMDIGANVDCRPQHLYQFAVMASSCVRLLQQNPTPRIGLLSNGEEVTKGNGLVKEAHALLGRSHLNFIGNVEGRDVYRGDVDVVVCDGFVGNISLKISEGLAEAAMMMLKREILKKWRYKLGYLLIRGAFSGFKKQVDYAEYGGAPLLGINGTGIICHGASNAIALRNAIEVASDMVRNQVNEAIIANLDGFEKGQNPEI
ncbi:phosphate acyltransferase PlsX [Desulfobulbus rhabdoformis]|uniref:phosphate acyltransferase PlsX n=1 Tax=Desulfobulbus rhabdoformis TaxID=34032 RepID=UPI001963A3ED|nr:phosphate acyltransferase PlsX [Desulfobulbus rhabdoformis]